MRSWSAWSGHSRKASAKPGEFRVFNQFTEQFSVNDLAERVVTAGQRVGLKVVANRMPNPRVEMEEHYYNAKHQKLLDLGLQPHYLGETLIESVIETVERHAARVDPVELEQPNVDWRRGGTAGWSRATETATPGEAEPRRVLVLSTSRKRRRPSPATASARLAQRR